MKRLMVLGAVGLLAAGTYQAAEIVTAKRLTIFNTNGRAAVVASTNQAGDGELIVYDSKGNEVFVVRHGAIEGDLARRLRVLERAFSVSQPPLATSRPAPSFIMQLESVAPMPPDLEKLEQAADLRVQADDRDVEADKVKAKLAQPYYHGKTANNWRDRMNRLMSDHRAKATQLRAQAIRLDKEAREPRQRLVGWNGQRTIILETLRDLSVSNTKIKPGDFITWRGTRTELTGDTERFSVHRIEGIARPPGFVGR